MEALIFDVIRIVLSLVEDAINGDSDAQETLKDILPTESYTKLVRKAQDKLDQDKFGPRS